MIKLPKDFFFGAAMSGPQTEGRYNVGGRLRSYWDMYSDMEINAFHNNVGSYVGMICITNMNQIFNY